MKCVTCEKKLKFSECYGYLVSFRHYCCEHWYEYLIRVALLKGDTYDKDYWEFELKRLKELQTGA